MLVLAMISLLCTVQYPSPGKVLHMMKTGLCTIVKPRYPLRGMLGGYIIPQGRYVAVFQFLRDLVTLATNTRHHTKNTRGVIA